MLIRQNNCNFEGMFNILKSLDSSKYTIDSRLAVAKYDKQWRIASWLCKIVNIDLKTECKELRYNNFIYSEKRFNIDDYIKLLNEAKQSSNLRIDGINVEVKFSDWVYHYFYNSRDDVFKINWAFHEFRCDSGARFDAHESLYDKALPFFPSFYELIEKYTKLNLSTHNGLRNSISIIIPVEKAKLLNFYLTADSLVFGIQTLNYSLKDLCAKVYFESGLGAVNQEFDYGELKQENNTLYFRDGLSKFEMILIDREGEILDNVEGIHELTQIESEPGTIMKIIGEGESDKVEFKTEEYDIDKLSHSIIAFSNSNGGIILIGVNDEGDIIGIKNRSKDRINQDIQNICHDKCIPSIKVKTDSVKIHNKELIIVIVSQNKGIQHNNGVFYIRKGGTNRKAHPHEVESLFKKDEEESWYDSPSI